MLLKQGSVALLLGLLLPRLEHGGRVLEDLSRLVDEFARECPVARLDGVADCGEGHGVVAGPGLGAVDDVFELGAVRDLECSC